MYGAPIATTDPSDDRLTAEPLESSEASPLMSLPLWSQREAELFHAYTRTWPDPGPVPLFSGAPTASTEPSEDRLTPEALSSLAASPSMSEPICDHADGGTVVVVDVDVEVVLVVVVDVVVVDVVVVDVVVVDVDVVVVDVGTVVVVVVVVVFVVVVVPGSGTEGGAGAIVVVELVVGERVVDTAVVVESTIGPTSTVVVEVWRVDVDGTLRRWRRICSTMVVCVASEVSGDPPC